MIAVYTSVILIVICIATLTTNHLQEHFEGPMTVLLSLEMSYTVLHLKLRVLEGPQFVRNLRFAKRIAIWITRRLGINILQR